MPNGLVSYHGDALSTLGCNLFNLVCTVVLILKCVYLRKSRLEIKSQQGCHWSGKSQGNSRSGKSQRILEYVREIWNFVESQGNLRKVREI